MKTKKHFVLHIGDDKIKTIIFEKSKKTLWFRKIHFWNFHLVARRAGGTYSIRHLYNIISKTLASKVPNNKILSILLFIEKPEKKQYIGLTWLINKIYVHQIQHYNQDQNIKNVIGEEYYCLGLGDSLIYQAIYSLCQ